MNHWFSDLLALNHYLLVTVTNSWESIGADMTPDMTPNSYDSLIIIF